MVVDANDDDYVVPYGWMFKGYIAFALWGHIPIPGGEKYKSSLMCAIEGDKSNVKDGTRNLPIPFVVQFKAYLQVNLNLNYNRTSSPKIPLLIDPYCTQ